MAEQVFLLIGLWTTCGRAASSMWKTWVESNPFVLIICGL